MTGAAGFLGTECVRQLRSHGHDIVTTDRRGTVDLSGDLADDDFCRYLPEVDTVLHAAAVQYLSTDLPMVKRATYFHRNNIVATRHLAARYADSRTHFVNVGTSMMYEQSGRDIYDVRSPVRGQGLYSASKIEAQALIDRLPNPTACIIPCIIAGDGRAGLFKPLTAMVRLGTVVHPGTGKHKVHVVHVQDAASLIGAVIEKRATGRFNAASSEPLSISEWVDEIAAELKSKDIRKISLPLWPVEMISAATGYRLLAREQLLMLRFPHVLSIEEGQMLGWTPRYTNSRIVRETARALVRTLAV